MTSLSDLPTLDGLPPLLRHTWMADLGDKLVDCGYPIIPIWPGAKCPGRWRGDRHGWQGYPDWSRHCDRPTKSFELSVWRNWPGCGIGIACGRIGALDIDILDAEIAAAVELVARQDLGDTPTFRVGRAPKRLLPYRMAEPFQKLPRHPLEWLGHGSQFVAYGIHPDTQEPYRWPAEELHEITVNRLPLVTQAQVVALLDKAAKIIPPELRISRLGPDRSAELCFAVGGDLRGTLEATAEAVAHIPNNDLPRTDWVTIGQAIKGSVGEDGLDIWLRWSGSSGKSGKSGKADTALKAWRTFKGDRIGFGSLQYYAQQHGWSPDPSLIFNAAKAEAAQIVDVSGLMAAKSVKPEEIAPEQEQASPAEIASPPDLDIVTGAGGIITKLATWMLETSSQPHPPLAIQAATALVGMLAAHKYRVRHEGNDTRTNVLMVGLAESSSGKDHARRCVKAILNAIGMADFYGEGFASGQAIESAFVVRAARLYLADEFGSTLEAALHPNGNPNLRKIVETITRIATSAAGMFKPADLAAQRDPDHAIPLTWDPCLCMIATGVEGPIWRALSSDNISNGSLARYLILRTTPFPDRHRGVPHFEDRLQEMACAVLPILVGPGVEVNELSVASALGALLAPYSERNGTMRRLDPQQPQPFPVPLSGAASDRLDEIADEQLALQRSHLQAGTHGLVGRLAEHVTRLALIAAISANPKAPVIEAQHVIWGEALARTSIAIMLDAAVRHVADSDHQRNRNAVLNEIVRLTGAGNVWVREREVRRTYGARSLKGDDFKAILQELAEMGFVERGADTTVGGRSPVIRRTE